LSNLAKLTMRVLRFFFLLRFYENTKNLCSIIPWVKCCFHSLLHYVQVQSMAFLRAITTSAKNVNKVLQNELIS